MEDLRDKWIDRTVRYRLAGDIALTVSVERPAASPSETIQADLVDISREGFKLATQSPLVFEEIIHLKLENPELDLNLVESAQVRWIREDAEKKTWIAGCSIRDEIPEDTLEQLIERGLLDRRESARNRITNDALAEWELSENAVPVQLLNLSTNGFCLATDEPCTIGARVKLTLSDDEGQSSYVILARAKWQQQFENGFLIGCELAMNDLYNLMGYFAPKTTSSKERSGSRNGKRLLLPVAITAAILAALFIFRIF